MNVIVLFNNNFRLYDNPAFYFAAKLNAKILPLYIFDEKIIEVGEASIWWLEKSIQAFNCTLLRNYNCSLNFIKGETISEISKIIDTYHIDQIFYNRLYNSQFTNFEKELQTKLGAKLIINKFDGNLLFHPHTIKSKKDGEFNVFTPFAKTLMNTALGDCCGVPNKFEIIETNLQKINSNFSFITPQKWMNKFAKYWQVGEEAARDKLNLFTEKVANYHKNRNLPFVEGTSKLSPHLHFGEISPLSIFYKLQTHLIEDHTKQQGINSYLLEIVWREFAHNLLIRYPSMDKLAIRTQFNNFNWEFNEANFAAWKQGKTGYPLVDAGMRELWETGWMHNRVRMIVASFLIKDLFISWQDGEKWFFQTLIDADKANNASSWQWVAGSGVDAAPFFRIFNPVLQGEKFDSNGEYVKKWIPELINLPSKYIHAPWKAPVNILSAANIILGKTYPLPIVNHEERRVLALKKLKFINQKDILNQA